MLNEYDVFVFDLDDTLVMTEKIHYQCWLETINNYVTVNFNFDEFCSMFHSDTENNIRNYLKNVLMIENYQKVTDEKNKMYTNIVITHPERFIMNSGSPELLQSILNTGKQFVIVTNTRSEIVRIFQKQFDIMSRATKIYCKEDFKNPKPNPECYLKVIDDFPNSKLIVFEDSITGIHAASSAQLDAIFVNSENYVHYSKIIKNYQLITAVTDFKELGNIL
jgi:putative hydrolase of the HAD superfamily